MPRFLRRPSLGSTGVGAVVTALALCLVAALPGAPAAVASRTVSETYPVPAGGTYTVTGHGYGHGHGMSQYGAQGAAKQGLGYRQIVSFYYPGTSVGSAAGDIRVLITADTDNDVRVVPASGLRVRDVASGTSYALATSGISLWRLRPVSGGTAVDYHDGAWHTWRTLGAVAEFYGPATVTLRVAGTDRAYRGALRLAASDTVNVLPLEAYVKGVVPREMPASWAPAAVQAQAVAARTYAAYDRAAHAMRYYQTCDTTSCQVYGGYGAEDSRSNAAVDATAGQVLLYGGQPAFTQFGSSSGGWTSAGGFAYLPAKADPYDGYSGNPVHTWSTSVTAARIQAAWPSIGTLQRVVVTQRDGNGEWYGRVEKLTLDGSTADVVVYGSTFRSRLGLRSQWFTLGTATSTTAKTTADTPITVRWKAIGGYSSVVRGPVSAEYAVGSGRARNYQAGRIYHQASTGAHELYGRVLRAYLRKGGATSRLGFPTTKPRKFRRGVYARFEHGVLRVYRSGRVTVRWY